MKEVIIGLGSNMGDRAGYLSQARLRIEEEVGEILRASSVIETESWGFDAPPFLNQVLVVRTLLEPLPLLDILQRIERDLGRREKTVYEDGVPRYQNRTIDLDILDYGGLVYQDERLTLPHPRITERDFVLQSLDELGIRIPTTAADQHLDDIPYNYIVVEGCIGAGKTTFSKMLAADYNAELVLERFADNPFLPKFYKDPVHYAFPVEMTFLMDRYQQLKNLLSARDLFKDCVIGDYFIDKCIIFSKNNLLDDEYNLYAKVFETISSFLPKPDLILYLYKDTEHLLQNIAKRGREYEKDITAEYLAGIQENYLNYFRQHANMPVLLVDATHLDFVQNPSDYQRLRQLVGRKYPAGIHRITF
ncbi:MAG: 2-amino-4-hydroxy-6-hydroxymethyldihydropteridine diphosphokinase [Bacteroidales bacterium]|nr:2-amino-4-hydroxy-6-hydroxymethyldihydropteridine diphosphokinase [Bacteroidales bacterium]